MTRILPNELLQIERTEGPDAPTATILMWKSEPLRCVLVVDPGKSFELRLLDGDRVLRTERLASPDAVASTASRWHIRPGDE